MSNVKDKKGVLVVGTGTIGEPLIGMLARLKEKLDLGDVYFHKRTPLLDEIPKVKSLLGQGAKLIVDENRKDDFQSIDLEVAGTFSKTIESCKVVIDCTPAGLQNKEAFYQNISPGALFVAQGSEKGFGTPYGFLLNDSAVNELDNNDTNYVQVVSCNTHAISRLCKALSENGGYERFVSGDFVCIRRANDASQDNGFVPSPTAGSHGDAEFGTHHARDVHDLLTTVHGDIFKNVKSSAMKTNSQYMHTIRFNIEVSGIMTKQDVIEKFTVDKMVALTRHKSANRIFSFGRDHGFYGRIYNQVVVSVPSITVFHAGENTHVVGFAFTPQDGNSLVSSAALAVAGVHGFNELPNFAAFNDMFHNEI